MTHADKARRDAKWQRRQIVVAAKREEQHRREAARRRSALMTYGGITVALVVAVGLVVTANLRNRSGLAEVPGARSAAGVAPGASGTPAPGPAPSRAVRGVVERFDDQGGTHIQLGQPHPAYNSDPPTSGWHTPQTANWGAFRNAIPDQILVHNLEHGGIWISYRDPNDAALVEKLEALTARYRSKVILTPRPANDAPIAVTAWTRLMKLDTYDEDKIVKFIDAFKNKGPERVPD